jgi:hypothetical protein
MNLMEFGGTSVSPFFCPIKTIIFTQYKLELVILVFILINLNIINFLDK